MDTGQTTGSNQPLPHIRLSLLSCACPKKGSWEPDLYVTQNKKVYKKDNIITRFIQGLCFKIQVEILDLKIRYACRNKQYYYLFFLIGNEDLSHSLVLESLRRYVVSKGRSCMGMFNWAKIMQWSCLL